MRHYSSGPRLLVVALGVFTVLGAVGARLTYLHVWTHAAATEEVAAVRRQVDVLPARRGDIVDRNGTPVATSRSVVRVGVDPVVLLRDIESIERQITKAQRSGRTPPPDFKQRWTDLASLLNMAPSELQARVESRAGTFAEISAAVRANEQRVRAELAAAHSGTPAPSAIPAVLRDAPATDGEDSTQVDEEGTRDGVPQELPATRGPRLVRYIALADAVEHSAFQNIRQLGLRGVVGARDFRRFYPNESLGAHVIGYVNREGTPAMGVERLMDFYLRGQDGWRESERDGRRRELARFRTREVPRVDGMTVQLSLDIFIQHMIETEIARIMEEFTPLSATIIVSEAETGFILGMANAPTFDLNSFFSAPLDHQRNRAISDVIEPGSTFKIVAVSGALNEGLVRPETMFDCSLTSVEVNGRTLRMPSEIHRFDRPMSVTEIVARSSNVGSAQMGIALGSERLHAYARAFGFGERTGFPLAGEVPGILFPPSRWDGLTITRLPIGHAVAATPLQIHMAMSSVANGGLLQQPQIVSRILTSDGATFATYEPVVRRRVISTGTAETMRSMLKQVASRTGTAREAEIPGYEIAGKTGTTQKIIDGRYSSQHHVATFSGFFPASSPRVVMTIVIDEANIRGVAYASRVAVPSFRRLAEQLIQYLGIAPVEVPHQIAATRP
jgi:cell division protein FtsI/penicillin-binding protein 2